MKKSFLFPLLLIPILSSYHQTSATFLIAGARSRKTNEGTLQSKCPICNQRNTETMKVYSQRPWVTLFFIAILPYGEKKYYLKCPQCKNYFRSIDKIDFTKVTQTTKPDSNIITDNKELIKPMLKTGAGILISSGALFYGITTGLSTTFYGLLGCDGRVIGGPVIITASIPIFYCGYRLLKSGINDLDNLEKKGTKNPIKFITSFIVEKEKEVLKALSKSYSKS